MMNLYDFSKEIAKTDAAMAYSDIRNKLKNVASSLYLNKQYLMLFNKERADITVIHFNKKQEFDNYEEQITSFADDVTEALINRGDVLHIDPQIENACWEIWIREKETNECFVYYLFDYTKGVIEL